MEPCHNCGRVECTEATAADPKHDDLDCVLGHGCKACEDCNAHTVDWRQRALDAEAQVVALKGEDWLGIYTPQANFGDDGTHTWADHIADLLGIEHTDDAQTLYLKLVEREGLIAAKDAEIARLREAIARLPEYRHVCATDPDKYDPMTSAYVCDYTCGAYAANAARAEARKAAGLE